MGKPIIRILYFQRRGIDANGYYRLNYIIQRGRKILYYATETKDFEYSDCFTSSCLAERKETILDTAQYIFKVHKVRYSRLILSPSYSYITRYKSRIRQICTATRFCKSDIIWTMCPRSFIPISKIPFGINVAEQTYIYKINSTIIKAVINIFFILVFSFNLNLYIHS